MALAFLCFAIFKYGINPAPESKKEPFDNISPLCQSQWWQGAPKDKRLEADIEILNVSFSILL